MRTHWIRRLATVFGLVATLSLTHATPTLAVDNRPPDLYCNTEAEVTKCGINTRGESLIVRLHNVLIFARYPGNPGYTARKAPAPSQAIGTRISREPSRAFFTSASLAQRLDDGTWLVDIYDPSFVFGPTIWFELHVAEIDDDGNPYKISNRQWAGSKHMITGFSPTY